MNIPTKYSQKISDANNLFKNKDYAMALRAYQEICGKFPKLSRVLKLNMQICRLNVKSNNKEAKRGVIFAGFSGKGVIENYVISYITGLRSICEILVYVCDNELAEGESDKLNGLTDHVIAGRHFEYDFGSYKRGFQWLVDQNLLESLDWVVLCNDSCYGPIRGFESIFESMERSSADFWGVTKNTWPEPHLQSYFLSFNKYICFDPVFREFLTGVTQKENVQEVIYAYEIKLTKLLDSLGYAWISQLEIKDEDGKKYEEINSNLTVFPIYLVKNGVELIKLKAFHKPTCNMDGIVNTLKFIKSVNQKVYTDILDHGLATAFEDLSLPSFSVIIPTHNRRSFLGEAIRSAITQDYFGELEIIIIDDGSTDDTRDLVGSEFADMLLNGQIVYIKLTHSYGVGNARNIGLLLAKNEWIAYLDSDNTMNKFFFQTYSNAILANPDTNAFYSRLKTTSDNIKVGQEYDYEELKFANYIDLGTFVHRRLGPAEAIFHDIKLKRLVDWDFILSFCKNNKPIFLPVVTIKYSDGDHERISTKYSFSEAHTYIVQKHEFSTKVTSIVLAYNHESYINECLESVCMQTGSYEHEIYFLDDCSSDGTWAIFLNVNNKFGKKMKGLKRLANIGQAGNLLSGIELSKGHYIAVIEGDDAWLDQAKLQKQVEFLDKNTDCSMVFTKIKVFDEVSGSSRHLKRQEKLSKNKLSGQDFLATSTMNPLGTFSSCVYRRSAICTLQVSPDCRRINEIAVAFYCEKSGSIGYLPEVMTLYRQHANGLWTGASPEKQLEMSIESRKQIRDMADKKWHSEIDVAINALLSKLNTIK